MMTDLQYAKAEIARLRQEIVELRVSIKVLQSEPPLIVLEEPSSIPSSVTPAPTSLAVAEGHKGAGGDLDVGEWDMNDTTISEWEEQGGQ